MATGMAIGNKAVLFLQQCLRRLSRPHAVILTYHDVSPTPSLLAVAPEEFAYHLSVLKESRANVVSLDELLAVAEKKKPLKRNTVLITFDDGYRGVHRYALPLLKQYGFPAALFVNPAYVGKMAAFATRPEDKARKLCNEEELRELAAGGVTIANHGWSHTPFDTLSGEEAGGEFSRAHRWIEEHIGGNSRGRVLAYPNSRNPKREIRHALGATHVLSGGDIPVVTGNFEPLPRVTVFPGMKSRFGWLLTPQFLAIKKERVFALGFASLLSLKILSGILLLFFQIPALPFQEKFFAPAGGDEYGYVIAGHEILSGTFRFTSPVGYPAFLAFLMSLTGATTAEVLSLYVIPLQVFVIFPLAIYALMRLIKLFFKKDWYAVAAGAIFLALPYVWFALFGNATLTTASGAVDPIGLSRSYQLFGLTMLSDYLSMLVAFFAILASAKLLKTPDGKTAARSGLLAGLLLTIRMQNILLLPVLALPIFTKAARRVIPPFFLALAMGALPQLAHNAFITGSPFRFADVTPDLNAAITPGRFGIQNILSVPEKLSSYTPLAPLIPIVPLLLFAATLWHFRKNIAAALFAVSGGILMPIALFSFDATLRNPRYFLPFFPFFLLAGFAAYETVRRKVKRTPEKICA